MCHIMSSSVSFTKVSELPLTPLPFTDRQDDGRAGWGREPQEEEGRRQTT